MDLLKQLTEQLGVSEDQAKGGAGLIFKMAKEKLSGSEFSQVTDAVPEAEPMMAAAPAGGGGGMLGGLLSKIGLGGKLGSMATIIAGFKKLGIGSDKIQGFIQTILKFVQEKGGDGLKNILSGVLK